MSFFVNLRNKRASRILPPPDQPTPPAAPPSDPSPSSPSVADTPETGETLDELEEQLKQLMNRPHRSIPLFDRAKGKRKSRQLPPDSIVPLGPPPPYSTGPTPSRAESSNQLPKSGENNEDDDEDDDDTEYLPSHLLRPLVPLRPDPRLTPRHRQPGRRIPNEVLELVCEHLISVSPTTLAALNSLDRSSYYAVMPFLYRSMAVRRGTLRLFLWGLPLPRPRGFDLRPIGKTADMDPNAETIERKTYCMSRIRELVVTEAPEIKMCEALVLHFQQTGERLFKSAHRLVLHAEAVIHLANYEINMWGSYEVREAHASAHPLIEAIREHASGVREIEIRGSIHAIAQKYNSKSQPIINRIPLVINRMTSGITKIERVIWHEATVEKLVHIPGAHHVVHFTLPYKQYHPEWEVTRKERIEQLYTVLRREHPPHALSSWQLIGSGLLRKPPPDQRRQAWEESRGMDHHETGMYLGQRPGETEIQAMARAKVIAQKEKDERNAMRAIEVDDEQAVKYEIEFGQGIGGALSSAVTAEVEWGTQILTILPFKPCTLSISASSSTPSSSISTSISTCTTHRDITLVSTPPRYSDQRPQRALVKLSGSLADSLFTPLLIARAATTSFLNPFRRAQAENASGQITVHIKWGRDRFNVPIPQPSITPLSQLLATLSTQTSIPLTQLKLVHKGAVLKDPSLTLTSYGITDGSTLVLVGKDGTIPNPPTNSSTTSVPKPAVVKKKNTPPQTDREDVLVDWIKSLVSNLIDPLQPAIATFTSQANPSATNRPAHIPSFESLQREHARLSELLLRGLLDLDGVEVPSAWVEARKERKEGVRRVQNELNKIDEAWGERKRLVG